MQPFFLIVFIICSFAIIGITNAAEIADVNDYAKIYKKQCATCHGNSGNGKGRAGASFNSRPTDFTSAVSKQMLSLDRIIKATRDGVPNTSMVAYGRRFDEKMLLGLANFIQMSFMGRDDLNVSAIAIGSGANEVATNDQKMANVKVGVGRQIYIDNCSACHGDKGESAVWARNGLMPPPRNFTTAEAKAELSRLRMITSVTHGRPGTAMMSFAKRLSEKEIEQVVDFIRTSFFYNDVNQKMPRRDGASHQTMLGKASSGMQEGVFKKTIVGGNMPLPSAVKLALQGNQQNNQQDFFAKKMPGNLIGDIVAGEKFYNNNCFVCHGKKGNGNGPRAHFNYPRPRDFTSIESHDMFNRPRLFSGISKGKRGSVMPAWETVLSKQQVADVAEYVFQRFIINDNVTKKKRN